MLYVSQILSPGSIPPSDNLMVLKINEITLKITRKADSPVDITRVRILGSIFWPPRTTSSIPGLYHGSASNRVTISVNAIIVLLVTKFRVHASWIQQWYWFSFTGVIWLDTGFIVLHHGTHYGMLTMMCELMYPLVSIAFLLHHQRCSSPCSVSLYFLPFAEGSGTESLSDDRFDALVSSK